MLDSGCLVVESGGFSGHEMFILSLYDSMLDSSGNTGMSTYFGTQLSQLLLIYAILI